MTSDLDIACAGALRADGTHRYLSTWCLHSNCAQCRSDRRPNGYAREHPGACKTCASPCVHDCHRDQP